MKLRIFIINALMFLFLCYGFAQMNGPKIGYRIINPEKVETKNYYFSSIINQSTEMKKIFSTDYTLRNIAESKYNQLVSCGNSYDSISSVLKFSDKEIEEIADRLSKLYQSETVLQNIYHDHVVASGCYYLLIDNSSPSGIIKKIWEQDANAMNRLIDVYGSGIKPYYPGIDSLSYTVGSQKHVHLMKWVKSLIVSEAENNSLFYHIPYYAGELLLDLNDRDEAIVYEPLWQGENKAAYERIKTIDWNKYTYSAIVVLGFGPDNYDFPLNPGAKIRLRTAAIKFKEGIAPFIVVTGGKVYPYKTRNVEAYHMKQYLIKNFSISEDQIIIEPHARHTTSNIRNTVRILFRNGIPMDKPMLASSSEEHINGVSSSTFAARCQRELGLVPYKLGKRIELNFVELYPLPNALQINPIEPLDP